MNPDPAQPEQGVDQFLDLGSGIPTAGNVHEVARAGDPEAWVAHVAIEPVAVITARATVPDSDQPAEVLARYRPQPAPDSFQVTSPATADVETSTWRPDEGELPLGVSGYAALGRVGRDDGRGGG